MTSRALIHIETLHLHIHGNPDEVLQRLDQTAAVLESLQKQIGDDMSQITDALDALNTKVAALETVQGSATALLKGLKDALDAALANNDPAAALASIQALSDKLGTDTDTLAKAVSDNTPAAAGGAGGPA